MSIKGRTWTAGDEWVSGLLNHEKESTGVAYRALAKSTGIRYSRLRDLSNRANGTPTLAEFIAICHAFGLDPADTLRRMLREVPDPLAPGLPPDSELWGLAANVDEHRDEEGDTPRD